MMANLSTLRAGRADAMRAVGSYSVPLRLPSDADTAVDHSSWYIWHGCYGQISLDLKFSALNSHSELRDRTSYYNHGPN